MSDRVQGMWDDESSAASAVSARHDFAIYSDEEAYRLRYDKSPRSAVAALGFDGLDEARDAAGERPDRYRVGRPRVTECGLWYFEDIDEEGGDG